MAYVLLGLFVYLGLVLVFLSLFVASACGDRLWKKRLTSKPDDHEARRRA